MLDLTSFDPMLKDHYAPGEVENIGYEENPAFALVKKRMQKTVGGRKWVQPVGTRLVNGGSSTFSTAAAKTANESKHDAFEPTRCRHYRFATIDNETIEATSTGDMDAFEPALDEIDKTVAAESNWANFRFYRSRGGALFRVTNGASATTIGQVDDPAGLWGVSQGDVVLFSATDGTSGATKAGSLTVASVQHPPPDAVGTVTFTANMTVGITAPANNDYAFLDGDFGLAPAGLADYVPDNATAAATTLYNFDRSVSNLLGGAIVDGTGLSMIEIITNMVAVHTSYAGKSRGREKVLFAHPYALGNLSKQLDGKWVIMQSASFDAGKSASVGISAFQVDMLGVKVNIITDRHCPVKRMYLLDISSWVMFHAGKFPLFLTERGGSIIIWSNTADTWVCRVGGYLNYCTKAPHGNVVALLP